MTSIASGSLTQQLYQRLFDRLDTDTSQGVSLDELKAAGGKTDTHASAFKALDTDTNGKISRAEMTGSSVALANETLSALVETQASPPPTALAASKATLSLLDGARSEQETQDINALFARADVDGDGKLSDVEWEAEKVLRRASNLDSGATSGPVFIAVDGNGDGLTSANEIRAARPIPLALVATAMTPIAVETLEDPLAAQQTTGELTSSASNGDDSHASRVRDIAAERLAAEKDFGSLAISDTLSARLLSQILAGLESQSEDLTKQTTA